MYLSPSRLGDAAFAAILATVFPLFTFLLPLPLHLLLFLHLFFSSARLFPLISLAFFVLGEG